MVLGIAYDRLNARIIRLAVTQQTEIAVQIIITINRRMQQFTNLLKGK